MTVVAVLPTEKAKPVLYLDIDGTVRQGKDDPLGRFVNGPEDVIVFPEAVERMREWKGRGGLIAGVSNQGGIALGLVDEGQVALAMAETHRQADKLFDLILWCKHHPNAKDPEMARCWCRKPSAGAIAEAAHGLKDRREDLGHLEMYPPWLGVMVGDRPEDRACAESAGLSFMDAAEWRHGADYD